MKHIAVIMLILSVLISFHSEAQTPYYYNSDGTHNSVNDKNWDVVTLKLDEEFSNETSTKTNWNYYWLGHSRIEKSDLFYLEGDVCYDNLQFITQNDPLCSV